MIPNPLDGPASILSALAIIGVLSYIGAIPVAVMNGSMNVAAMLVISILAFTMFFAIEVRGVV